MAFEINSLSSKVRICILTYFMVRCKDFIKIHFLAESKKGTRNRKPEGLYNLHSCRSQVIVALF